MRHFLVSVFLVGILLGCGVKAPPIAPVRAPEPAVLNLDCEPEDPKCDRTDPNYGS